DPAPRREPALPRDKTQQARTSPAPPGPPLRDGAGGMSEGVEETRFWPPPDDEEESEAQSVAEPAAEEVPAEEDELPRARQREHAEGALRIPDGYGVIEGGPNGARRSGGSVVGRFSAGVTGELLARALDELERAGVGREAVTVVPVPGAFELPLAAMALAKTRRYSCIVALGAVIRGETPHFDHVANEPASGLQLDGNKRGECGAS